MSDRFYDLFTQMDKLPEGSFITRTSDGWTWRYGEWMATALRLDMLLENVRDLLLSEGMAAVSKSQPLSKKEVVE